MPKALQNVQSNCPWLACSCLVLAGILPWLQGTVPRSSRSNPEGSLDPSRGSLGAVPKPSEVHLPASSVPRHQPTSTSKQSKASSPQPAITIHRCSGTQGRGPAARGRRPINIHIYIYTYIHIYIYLCAFGFLPPAPFLGSRNTGGW